MDRPAKADPPHCQTAENLDRFLDRARPTCLGDDGIRRAPIANETAALRANRDYFDNPKWAKCYFDGCHRDRRFAELWRRATGSWDGKIVVDIGCGPGNLFATVGGAPRVLIGVDVSTGALRMAAGIGYTPLLADAHDLPLRSGFADLVALNATLHHCDAMGDALAEAARLVRPGGRLVTNHDPQRSAWDFKGFGLLLWQAHFPIYRMMGRPGHTSMREQGLLVTSEVHHRPGRGVMRSLFQETLAPLGFDVAIYPNNHNVGAEVLQGRYGLPQRRIRLAQALSGINPRAPEAALSLMCVANKHREFPVRTTAAAPPNTSP